MSSKDVSNLANMGSTYPATKSEAITLSSDLSSSSVANHQGAPSTWTIPTQSMNSPTKANPLNAHYRPSLSAGSGDSRGVEGSAADTKIRRASLAQNAPGKLGERGENGLGAMGFGGSTVEWPKEGQGMGEKLVEFLGTRI